MIQHNGAGTVTIDGFQVADFGKLYRSCGNCKQSAERHVVVKNVKASSGKLLVGINPNFGDSATIDSATCATGVKEICEREGRDISSVRCIPIGGSACGRPARPLAERMNDAAEPGRSIGAGLRDIHASLASEHLAS